MSDIFIFDTNSLVSAALISTSVSRKALNKAIATGELAISKATFEELIEVIFLIFLYKSNLQKLILQRLYNV